MKTLIIHPNDTTTDFLSDIYNNKNFTVLRDNLNKNFLIEQISKHDRIIIMGHGNEEGLFLPYFNQFSENWEYKDIIINKRFVKLLKTKETILIWCNANIFVNNNYLTPKLYTGMIISDLDEALCFLDLIEGNFLTERQHLLTLVNESNEMFSKTISNFLDTYKIENYSKIENSVINFNNKKIYTT